jgi:transposase
MQVMDARCAGVDVHKKTVVAGVLTPAGQATRTCGPMTAELLSLADWLLTGGCTHVAIESTGDSWKPVCNSLEGTCAVRVVKAQHVKAMPGRKTDVKDAAWLAELLPHGLWRASVIPPVAQRELRDLTRSRRPCIRERVTWINRVQQLWEDANM